MLHLENHGFWFLLKNSFVFCMSGFCSKKLQFFIFFFFKNLPLHFLKLYQNIYPCFHLKMTILDFCLHEWFLFQKGLFHFFSETLHYISLKVYQNIYPFSHLKITVFDFCKKVLIVRLEWFLSQKIFFWVFFRNLR